MTKRPFKVKGNRAKEVLELVHSDVCGPMTTQAKGGFQYFITFIDDYSKVGYAYLMRHKSESFEKFQEFRALVETRHGYPSGTKGYEFYSLRDKKVFVSTNAKFLEEDYVMNHKSSSEVALEELRDTSVSTSKEPITQVQSIPEISTSVPQIVEPRRSGRVPREPERYIGLGESSELDPDGNVSDPWNFK
ncbi:uncharacterized protein LOC121754493 [Salvia splendens]|uniref:uncharacterized protein LOC121754493 n=1 Tax=Salvia splendens TaxID=180675 RepID=UPI001C25247C|nr:uncharacterized protein LOC121754493 [Salvia splendens]